MYCGGDDVGAIVADFGSYSSRVGFAGEDCPRGYLPTAAGLIQSEQNDPNKIGGKEYVFDIHRYRENLSIEAPIQDGLVCDWDAMEKLWEHTIATYCGRSDCNLKDTPLLLAEKPYVPLASRHRMCETMFEKYSTPALFLSKDAVLAAYACGKTGGLVIDVGASGTVVTPVQDGWVETKGMCRSLAGGRLIDAHISSNIFSQRYGTLTPSFRLQRTANAAEPTGVQIAARSDLGNVHPSYDALMKLECARDIKESLAKTADSALQENDPRYANIPVIPYELPDGTLVEVNIERFQMAEVLFDPAPMAGQLGGDLAALYKGRPSAAPGSLEGIPKIVGDAIVRSDAELQTMLLSNMMLTGGSAAIDGLSERLKAEVEMLIYQGGAAGYKTRMMSVGVSERALCPWLGGSIVASLGSFHELWVTRQEYLESGTSIIDRKCP